MLRVTLRNDWCKGCGLCVHICRKKVFVKDGAISERGYAVFRPERVEDCSGCGLCELLCPDLAITVEDAGED